MEPILCHNCFEFFPPSPRHKHQKYCMKPACRRAKKAAWKRLKMDTDPKFKKDQYLINKKWAQNHPGYWKAYRRRNPRKSGYLIIPIILGYFNIEGRASVYGFEAGYKERRVFNT